MQLVNGGNLQQVVKQRMKSRYRLNEKQIYSLIRQLVLGVQFLHANGIAHRDIKPSNVLYDGCEDEINYFLTDFGCIRMYDETLLKTQVGTKVYHSPEQIRIQDYDETSDIWSLGVTLYEIISNLYPFGDSHLMENTRNFSAIIAAKIKNIDNIPAKINMILK